MVIVSERFRLHVRLIAKPGRGGKCIMLLYTMWDVLYNSCSVTKCIKKRVQIYIASASVLDECAGTAGLRRDASAKLCHDSDPKPSRVPGDAPRRQDAAGAGARAPAGAPGRGISEGWVQVVTRLTSWH